jgi:hypothetical protein
VTRPLHKLHTGKTNLSYPPAASVEEILMKFFSVSVRSVVHEAVAEVTDSFYKGVNCKKVNYYSGK